jgi:hypothetical protein
MLTIYDNLANKLNDGFDKVLSKTILYVFCIGYFNQYSYLVVDFFSDAKLKVGF